MTGQTSVSLEYNGDIDNDNSDNQFRQLGVKLNERPLTLINLRSHSPHVITFYFRNDYVY